MSHNPEPEPPDCVPCEQCGSMIPFRAGRCQFCGSHRAAYLQPVQPRNLEADLPKSAATLGIWIIGLWFAIPAASGLFKLLKSGMPALDPMTAIIYVGMLVVLGARLAGCIGLLMRERWATAWSLRLPSLI